MMTRNLNVFPLLCRLLILLCGLVRLLVFSSNIVPQLPTLDKCFYFVLQDSAFFNCMSNVVMVATILRIVMPVHMSPDIRRNSENPKMLIVIIDHRNWYSIRGVFTNAWYLVVLRSWVPVAIVASLILFASTIFVAF